MKNWFESWFDTKYYHILYKNRDESEAEFFIKKITEKLDIQANKTLLDLACGKGRHAMFLNTLGYNVVGVDLSASSIKSAKKSENNRLKFFTHDMRDPIEGYKFDFVFNLFTSIGYFDDEADNVNMLRSIYSYMNKDGILVIDFLNEHKVKATLESHATKTIDNIDFHIEKKIVNGIIEKRISFHDEGEDFAFEERVHALTLDNFKSYLKLANFEILELAGDYHLNQFDREKSDRLIIFAKKNK
ncbi:MAG: class I SAM-dependent methyltransferase [Crocinitomicaceae bacterium]